MKILTLLRHAKSSWKDASCGDHQRTLNGRGKRDAPMMGTRMRDLLAAPEFVICSDAKRTLETAHLLLPAMKLPLSLLHPDSRIYLASASTLLSCIEETPNDINHVMLIGHNPGLETLCDELAPDSVPAMVTCAVSCFELETDDWNLTGSCKAKLKFHDYPKSQAA